MQRTPSISRRRFLRISAIGAIGAAVAPGAVLAGLPGARESLHQWRGVALGAQTSITLSHGDKDFARECLKAIHGEVDRLENIFSLYREESALANLNRHGALAKAPPELVEILQMAHGFSQLTDGAFDITVAPLWSLYTKHFSHEDADPDGPSQAERNAARQLVNFKEIHITQERISFGRPAMAATLNGIAQGFITDRICALLESKGFKNMLVNMGETRALGTRGGDHSGGRPWRVGIADPADFSKIYRTIYLENMAMATSGGYGTPIDRGGRFHHLFDPATGDSADRFESVTVVAKNATTADALSTAFSIMEEGEIKKCLRQMEGVQAYIIGRPD